MPAPWACRFPLMIRGARRTQLAFIRNPRIREAYALLGGVDAGYERESETDGPHARGPSIALQLPLFNQGEGRVLRARADLESAHARLDALELGVRNGTILDVETTTLDPGDCA